MKIFGKWKVEHELKSEYKEEYSVYKKLNENIRIPIINTETKEKVAEFCLCSIVDSDKYMILKMGSTESIMYEAGFKLDIKNGEHSIVVGDQMCHSSVANTILLERSNIYTNKLKIEMTACEGNENLENIDGSLDVLLGHMIIEETEQTPNQYSLDWRGLKINYDSNKFEITPNATDDYGDRYYLSFKIKEKLEQSDYKIDYINICKYENVLKYDLEQLCLEYEKMRNAGVYYNVIKPKKEYKIYKYIDEENSIEYTLNNKQLHAFADGKNITVNGETINRKELFSNDEYKEFRNKEFTNVAGQEAITFIKEEYYDTTRYYLIIVDDMVYEISIPTMVVPYLTAQEFIDGLEIIK